MVCLLNPQPQAAKLPVLVSGVHVPRQQVDALEGWGISFCLLSIEPRAWLMVLLQDRSPCPQMSLPSPMPSHSSHLPQAPDPLLLCFFLISLICSSISSDLSEAPGRTLKAAWSFPYKCHTPCDNPNSSSPVLVQTPPEM